MIVDLATAMVRLQADGSVLEAALERAHGQVNALVGVLGHINPPVGVAFAGMASASLGANAAIAGTVAVATDLQHTYATLRRVTGLAADETGRLADKLKKFAVTRLGVSRAGLNAIALSAGRMGWGGTPARGRSRGSRSSLKS